MGAESTPSGRRRKVETLRFAAGKLELLDQRLLPHTHRYEVCGSAAEVAAAIRSMVVRGAPAIGCAAAYGVALEGARFAGEPRAAFEAALDAAFTLLAESRPTAVNLFWALDRMRRALQAASSLGPFELSRRLLDEAATIQLEDVANNRQLGEHGAALLRDGSTVLTHCNAGALATAGHGTALGVVRSAVEAGKRISVIAGETRPFLQGARLTAWELAEEGIPVTLITDNMAGHLIARGEIQAVVVGADRVALNGDVANKIGTYMVAVLARRHGIPFYVACPIATIDATVAAGHLIPIEERGGAEVTGYGELCWAPEGVRTRNPAFDVTPAELVTALVSERGVVFSPDAKKIRALLDA